MSSMNIPSNVVPLVRLDPPADDETQAPPYVLGILHRQDFELWVCRLATGALSLKWWRWREDLGRFFPLEDGELTLAASDLPALAELLVSVDGRMNRSLDP